MAFSKQSGGGGGSGGAVATPPSRLAVYPDTSSGLHLAIGGISDTTADGLLSVNPVVETVWNWNVSGLGSFPQIPKGKYAPNDRQSSDTAEWPGAQSLAWFLDNHPDWIEYQADRQTIAYEFSTLGVVLAAPAPTTTTFTTSAPLYGAWANGRVQVGTQSGTISGGAGTTAITLAAPLAQAPKAGQTVAQGDDRAWPLNVANPACLAWLETNVWKPVLDSGNYSIFGVDNFQLTNAGSFSGQRVGHYTTAIGTATGTAGQSQILVTNATGLAANGFIALGGSAGMEYKQIAAGYAGGTTVPLTTALANSYGAGTWLGLWTAQYAGTGNDAAYRAYQIALSTAIASWLHAAYPTMVYSPNFSYDNNFDADSRTLIATADVLFTEDGFTNGGNSPYKFTDASWQNHASAYWAFLSQSSVGWIDENHTSANVNATTAAERLWVIANYLLLKNSRSWMYMKGPTDLSLPNHAVEYQTAQALGAPVGQYYADQNVYRRDFENGVVLVNHSSSTARTVTIPPYAYKDLNGLWQPGSVTLPAASGLVLIGKYTSPASPLVRGNPGAYGNRGTPVSGFTVAATPGSGLGAGTYIYSIAYVTTGGQIAVPTLQQTIVIAAGANQAVAVTMPKPGAPVIGRLVYRSVVNPTGYVNVPPMWLCGDYRADNLVATFTDTMDDVTLQKQLPAPSMVVSPDQIWMNQVVVTKGMVIQSDNNSSSALADFPGWLYIGSGGLYVGVGNPTQINGHIRLNDTSNIPTFINIHANIAATFPNFVTGIGSDTRGWVQFQVTAPIPANTRLFTFHENNPHSGPPQVQITWYYSSTAVFPAVPAPGFLYGKYNTTNVVNQDYDLYCSAAIPADANVYMFTYMTFS